MHRRAPRTARKRRGRTQPIDARVALARPSGLERHPERPILPTRLANILALYLRDEVRGGRHRRWKAHISYSPEHCSSGLRARIPDLNIRI